MAAFLRLNGRRLEAEVEEAEQTILQVAAGALDRAALQAWIEARVVDATAPGR
jgi:prophage maintenance system killer protein